jgi:hypothetical protein
VAAGEGAEFQSDQNAKPVRRARCAACGRCQLIAEHMRGSRNSEPVKVRHETSHGREGEGVQDRPRYSSHGPERRAPDPAAGQGVSFWRDRYQAERRFSLRAAVRRIRYRQQTAVHHRHGSHSLKPRAGRLAPRGGFAPPHPRRIFGQGDWTQGRILARYRREPMTVQGDEGGVVERLAALFVCCMRQARPRVRARSWSGLEQHGLAVTAAGRALGWRAAVVNQFE